MKRLSHWIPNDENHDFSDEIWDRLVPQRARTVGSGVLITNDGYILTNNHVIEELKKWVECNIERQARISCTTCWTRSKYRSSSY